MRAPRGYSERSPPARSSRGAHGTIVGHERSRGARGQRVSPSIASSVMSGALYGLHHAHEASGASGEPLHLVHRDVSPQNVIVGVDGVARMVDFGVARAAGRLPSTGQGSGLKGK